ncbi:hypothetical protein AHIS2_p018 [Acaryochloris phage A-HIS2]|nr:hypothetical protein AHIS2_p018 [Acaryochloris phage A-HIS2]
MHTLMIMSRSIKSLIENTYGFTLFHGLTNCKLLLHLDKDHLWNSGGIDKENHN